MSLIEDGKGTGSKAQVDDENALIVNAITSSSQHHANHIHGGAYTMDLDGVVVAGDGYNFVYIQNTADEDMHITSINIWMNQAKEDDNIEVWLGHVLTSVANNTSITPGNTNAGSGQSASGVFYVNDGGGNLTTLAGGVVAGRWKPTATMENKWTKRSCWILPKNQTFTLLSSKDNKITGYISFYYHKS